jgi:hypothetical protein
MENPKPVLVCRTEATNIIHKKNNTVSKFDLPITKTLFH